MPAEVIVLTREDFDATCRQYRLKPEVVYAEGYIEAHYRLRRFHGHLTEAPSITYRAPLTTEENTMTETTCTCGAPDAYCVSPNERLVHRSDGPCTIETAVDSAAAEGGEDRG